MSGAGEPMDSKAIGQSWRLGAWTSAIAALYSLVGSHHFALPTTKSNLNNYYPANVFFSVATLCIASS